MVHEHMVNGVHLSSLITQKRTTIVFLNLNILTVPVVPGSVVVEAGTRYLYNVYLCIF